MTSTSSGRFRPGRRRGCCAPGRVRSCVVSLGWAEEQVPHRATRSLRCSPMTVRYTGSPPRSATRIKPACSTACSPVRSPSADHPSTSSATSWAPVSLTRWAPAAPTDAQGPFRISPDTAPELRFRTVGLTGSNLRFLDPQQAAARHQPVGKSSRSRHCPIVGAMGQKAAQMLTPTEPGAGMLGPGLGLLLAARPEAS